MGAVVVMVVGAGVGAVIVVGPVVGNIDGDDMLATSPD